MTNDNSIEASRNEIRTESRNCETELIEIGIFIWKTRHRRSKSVQNPKDLAV